MLHRKAERGNDRTTLGHPASPLRALVAERRAGQQPRATACTQAVHAYARRRHLSVNCHLREQWKHVGRLHTTGPAGKVPRLDARDELAEKLHQSLGSSRASLA